MSKFIEKAEMMTLPVVVLKGAVAFPAITINLEISDEESINSVKNANAGGSHILLVTSKIIKDAPFSHDELYNVGTIAKIKQSLVTPEGSLRIIAEGIGRAIISSYNTLDNGSIIADVLSKAIIINDCGVKGQAYMREVIESLEETAKMLNNSADELILAAKAIEDPGFLADFVASNMLVKFDDKQMVLECFEPIQRMEALIHLLAKERLLLEYEMDIHKKVRARLNQAQKERYLQEQIRVLHSIVIISSSVSA